MQINELMQTAKDKVIRLREVIISPVAPQQQWQEVLQQARARLALALMLIGAVTVLTGLISLFVSPGVQRRGAEMQRLQDDYSAGKITWQQYQDGVQEAKK